MWLPSPSEASQHQGLNQSKPLFFIKHPVSGLVTAIERDEDLVSEESEVMMFFHVPAESQQRTQDATGTSNWVFPTGVETMTKAHLCSQANGN